MHVQLLDFVCLSSSTNSSIKWDNIIPSSRFDTSQDLTGSRTSFVAEG